MVRRKPIGRACVWCSNPDEKQKLTRALFVSSRSFLTLPVPDPWLEAFGTSTQGPTRTRPRPPPHAQLSTHTRPRPTVPQTRFMCESNLESRKCRYAFRAVQFHPHGVQFEFARLPARTMRHTPMGVRVVSQTKSRQIPTRNIYITALFRAAG